MRRLVSLCSSFVLLGLGSGCRPSEVPPPKTLKAEVIETLPRDNQAFTQGFLYHEGKFYESTGQYGESSLRRTDPETGRVEEIHYLSEKLFGEGLALMNGRLHQLTWKAGAGIIYDLTSFDRVGSFEYSGEGWGLTSDGTHLILSDGTSRLRFLDPATFKVVRTLTVRDHRGKVADLNELEFIDGEIWANLWYRDDIIRISPETGHVTGILPLAGRLRPRPRDPDAVMNGIAWNEEKEILYVTGKDWSHVFGLRLRSER